MAALMRFLRLLARVLLWALLALVLILLPLLAVLGSEGGSRWLLEQGLGMQRVLTARYQGGTWLGGLELADVRVKTNSLDLQIRHALARWSVMQLLQGTAQVDSLRVEGVTVRLTAPPSGKPPSLPLLVLPLRLVVEELVVEEISIHPWQATKPLTVARGELAGVWKGSRLDVQRLYLAQEQLGELSLHGRLRTRGGYALAADGQVDLLALRQQGLQPLEVRLRQEVADLLVEITSQGALIAKARGRVRPLLPDLPYSAQLEWQAFASPWLPAQKLASQGGQLRVTGDKAGLRTLGEGGFSGLHVPAGHYRWRAATDWKSARVESLNFKGDLGQLDASGTVGWREGLTWTLNSRFQNLNLARQWPVPAMVVPTMTGTLESRGSTRANGSTAEALLRLDNGERWQVQEKGASWLWNLKARQDVRVQWQQVRRQLPGIAGTYSEQGTLNLSGSLDGYRLTLDAGLAGDRLPTGSWKGLVTGAQRHIEVESLRYEGEAGRLEAGGELDVGESLRWRGTLVLGDFATGWLLPDWAGRFTGHLAGQGSWGRGRREIRLEDSHLTGQLREQPFSLDGALTVVLPVESSAGVWPQAWSPGLRLGWGDNRAELHGGLEAGQWNLALDLDLKELAVLDPRLQGEVAGTISLRGEERQPDVNADIRAGQLGLDTAYARELQLLVNMPSLGQAPGTVSLQADGITVGQRDLGKVTLDLGGTLTDHQLRWGVETDHARSSGRLSGNLDRDSLHWQGEVEEGQFSLPELDWSLAQSFAVEWRHGERQLQLAPHCWQSGVARFCNEEELRVGPSGHVRLKLEGLQAERLASLLPDGLQARGLITGHVNGEWEPEQAPRFNAALQAEEGDLTLGRDAPLPPLVLGYQRLGLTAEADPEKVDLAFNLASSALGQGQVQVSVQPYGEVKPLAGTLALQGLRLDVIQPFFPALATLTGAVSANGRIEGTLQQPEYWGDIRLAQGELGLHKLPVNLHDITAHIDVRGNAARIDGTLKSGEGSATLAGEAGWKEQPHLNLTLKGQRLELRQQPELLAEVDPDLALQVVPGRVDLTGMVRVPMARLNVKSLGSGAVPLSQDVVIVDNEGALLAQTTRQVANWLINADVSVRLGDDVFFHGYGVNGRLMGALRLRQQGRRGLEASGEVELDKDARYDAYGQRLLIRRGRLIFAGNLTQPGLDVEAVREVDSQVVGLRVAGRVSTPEVSFFSDDGGLSQEEILSYLVLGRPLDQQGGENNLSAAAAAIKLGATGGAGLTTRIGETFGITDLAVDAEGSGDDTQVTVSGYLSPKLYLRYGVGIFTPVNTATMRYKINAKVYLEAVSSLESAIDLFYTLRF